MLFDVFKIIFLLMLNLLKFIADILCSPIISANYYVYYAISHFHKGITEFHKYVQPSFN